MVGIFDSIVRVSGKQGGVAGVFAGVTNRLVLPGFCSVGSLKKELKAACKVQGSWD